MAKPTPVRGVHAATPMPEAARALIGARLADVQRHLGKLGPELGTDEVHDTRVATRRLRAALALYGDRKRARRADRVLRSLQDALGEVRDVQVQLDAFSAMAAKAPPPERTALNRVRKHLAARLPERADDLRGAVPRWQQDGIQALGRLEQLKPKGKLGGHRLRGKMVADLEKLEARLLDAQRDPSVTPMHELRKTVKRFRYSLELLTPAMPTEIEEILGALTPLQERLGKLHDTDVRLELVDDHGDASTQGTDAVLRRLRVERDRQAQDTLRALESWEEEAVALRSQVLLSASPLKRGAPRRGGGRG